METWADTRLAKVLEALHRLYGSRDAQTFPEVMMSIADDLVPCVNLSFDIINTATGAARNGFLRKIPLEHADFMERWAHLSQEHPGINFLKSGGQASVFTINDFLSQREFSQTGLYHDIFQVCGTSHQMGIILPVAGHVVGIAMNRDSDFTEEERRLITHLQPHFLQAFQRTQIFASLQGEPAIDYLPWRRHGLTLRECEVLQWLTQGQRNREIAVILGLQSRTVDTHVVNLFRKLGVQNRTAAANRGRDLLLGLKNAPDLGAAPHHASLRRAGEPSG